MEGCAASGATSRLIRIHSTSTTCFLGLHGRAVISGTFSKFHRHVNQRLKRDRLPSASTMSRGEARITGWWEQAYLWRAETLLPIQFMQEARASLPGFSTGDAGDVFSAVCLQRIRLHHDQQVPEWEAR